LVFSIFRKTDNIIKMKLQKALLILLVIIGIVMIVLGVKTKMIPPALTGLGFFIIAYILNQVIINKG